MDAQNQMQDLVSLMQSIRLDGDSEGEYQILNLVQMMDNISLQSLTNSVLGDSPSKSGSMEQDTSNSTTSSDDALVPLMRFPNHINDHWKLSWMAKEGTPVELLMSEACSLQDCYLNQYFRLIHQGTSPFTFVKTYPGTLNLKSCRRYRAGEVMMEIDKQWFLTEQQFARTQICNYLRMLSHFIQLNTQNFLDQDGEDIIKAMKACLKFEDTLYLFEKKFVLDILNTPIPRNDCYAEAEWLYFKLLPTSFGNLPVNHVNLVKKYHPIIGNFLEGQNQYMETIFKYVKDIIKGKGIQRAFQFKNYLTVSHKNGESLYDLYQKMMTPKNFAWAYCCERTRVYLEETNFRHYRFFNSPQEIFVPILDLIPHSYKNPNVRWEIDPITEKITVYASRQIECGQILTTFYSSMPLQSGYSFYGCVDADSDCKLKIKLNYEPKLIYRVMEVRFNQHIRPEIKELILEILETSSKEMLTLEFSSIEYRENSIQEILANLTIYALKDLVRVAEAIYFVILNPDRSESKYKKNKHQKDLRKNLFYMGVNSLKKDRELMKSLSISIKESIESEIMMKELKMKQIRNELSGKISPSTEYQLMCLYTLLHQEHKLLETVRQSIYSVNKGQEMVIEI